MVKSAIVIEFAVLDSSKSWILIISLVLLSLVQFVTYFNIKPYYNVVIMKVSFI